MKILKTILRVVIIMLVIICTVYVVRNHNDNKYRPKNYNSEDDLDPTDISSYNQIIKGVDVSHIEGEYLNGFRLKPKNKIHPGLIITFGGSEGSPAYWYAEDYAKRGYEVLALFYFGMENQAQELVRVPLDFFDEVLDYIEKNIDDSSPITIDGGSKGAELALNLAVRYPQIDNLILRSPSAYSFSGLSKKNSGKTESSWAYKGKDIPYIDIQKSGAGAGLSLFKSFVLNEAISFRNSYEKAVENSENSEEARIKVEDTKAKILAFAGDGDQMWQSDEFVRKIKEIRPKNTEIHIYKNAGHVFSREDIIYTSSMIIKLGGSRETNQKVDKESRLIIEEKLNMWHK